MMEKIVTLASSTHRPETLPFAAHAMRGHEAIFLEEPLLKDFVPMLEGAVSIDDYILQTDFEFPAFAKESCELFRELHREGKVLCQVEPFMETLAAIHELFADGGGPKDVLPRTPMFAVYEAERLWTAALLDFYKKSVGACFRDVVRAVQNFARADAARGRLRDLMRARSVAELLPLYTKVYVEMGYIHVALPRALKKLLPPGYALRRVYLMEPVVQKLMGKRQVLGPGDVLTILYTFRPDFTGKKADLLAAKSLIHIKALHKEEIPESPSDPAPHTRNEIETNRLVGSLSFEDCERLYGQIRNAGTKAARDMVRAYLAG
ncbi:MAG: hypothetical protein SVS15_04035 [Thermodesulfobacteriota bacterium]|nr:hypothetical protein [Thermodesulfobacteriota bacterium]